MICVYDTLSTLQLVKSSKTAEMTDFSEPKEFPKIVIVSPPKGFKSLIGVTSVTTTKTLIESSTVNSDGINPYSVLILAIHSPATSFSSLQVISSGELVSTTQLVSGPNSTKKFSVGNWIPVSVINYSFRAYEVIKADEPLT